MRAKLAQFGLTLIAGVWLVSAMAVPAGAQQSSSAMSQVGLVRTGTGSFSLDVEGADLRSVMRAISEFSGKNIVMGNNVKGTVRVSLRNVTWQDALRTVLRSNGLDYVEEGSIIRVDDATKLNAESVEREQAKAKTLELIPLETRILKLNYANAAEIAPTLTPGLTKRGSIQVEKRTNAIIVTDLTQNVETIARMAGELDSTTPQIEITAKLVDVDVSALRDIGVEWNHGFGESKFIVDGAGDQIQLEPARNSDGSIIEADRQNTGIADAATQVTFGIFKNWGSLEASLEMLEENRKANIISNPRITTVDNREAKITVGQKIPLIVQDVSGNPVSQLQTIGIQLRVTPHLTQDKKIIMDLHPEVSDLSTQSTVQGGIIINTSEADTRVMVDDGQTAVIGGLIRSNQSMVRRGVPYLKDIPLLGMLFRSNSTTNQNRELIIFVTPRIVTSMASN